MGASPRRLRPAHPDPPGDPALLNFDTLIRELVAAGDRDFVEYLADLMRHRIAWISERESHKNDA